MRRHLLLALLTLGFLLGVLPVAPAASYTFTTIDVPGATITGAQGISPRGQIVGQYQEASGVNHGYLLSDGSFTTIDPPGPTNTAAQGINAKGQIVGFYAASGSVDHGSVATP